MENNEHRRDRIRSHTRENLHHDAHVPVGPVSVLSETLEEDVDMMRSDGRFSSDHCLEESFVEINEQGVHLLSDPSESRPSELFRKDITESDIVDLGDADFEDFTDRHDSSGHVGKAWLNESYRGDFQPVRSAAFTNHSAHDDHVEELTQPESLTTSSLRALLENHISLTNVPAEISDEHTAEAHALCEIFSDVVVPAFPFEIVKTVLDQERLSAQVKVELPDVTIATHPRRVRSLLTARSNNSFLLLQLPDHFSKAFLRILTRVLSYETDDEYDQVKGEVGPVVLNPPPLSDHSTIRPHTRYNVARLQCRWPGKNRPAITDMLRLVEAAFLGELSKPLARLLGLFAIGGITPGQLREWMNLTQKQSLGAHARIALVQALRTAALGSSRSHVLKSPPRHFFCFGQTEGLQKTIHGLPHWPFRNDFGMALWFRAERFDGNPTLFSARSDDGGGIEVALAKVENPVSQACTIVVSIYDSKAEEPAHQLKVNGYVMLPRVWYHLAIRHSQSRLKGVFSLGARYQISILIDGKTMTTTELPFPKVSQVDFEESSSSILNLRKSVSTRSRLNMKLSLGKQFDGETGALYLFNDSVSDASLRALFDATGGRAGALRKISGSYDSWDTKASSMVRESRVLDENTLDDFVPKSRKRVFRENAFSVIDIETDGTDDKEDSEIPPALQRSAFASKIFLSWDPKRVVENQVIELQTGAHVEMLSTRSWSLSGVPDEIKSLGGVQTLLPIIKSFVSLGGDQSMNCDALAMIIPCLFDLVYAFVNDHNDNARELLRCGGIDIIADLLMSSKNVAIGKVADASIIGAVCSDVLASTLLVQSLVRLQSCCTNNFALEAKIFSRLLFNIPLWLGDSLRVFHIELHKIILPVMSQITRTCPGRVRDCVKIKDLIVGLSTGVDSGGKSHEGGMKECDPLVSTIILGIIFTILSTGVTVKDLSPLLNYIADLVTRHEGAKLSLSDSAKENAVGACVVLLFLFKQKPVVSGLLESFAQCCGSVHNGAAWIICSLINIDDDEIRALGIRILDAYLNVTSEGPDDVLSLGPSLGQARDTEAAHGSDVTVNAIRASNKIRDRLAKSLTGMGIAGRMSTPASPRIAYKFLWHVLKSRRYQLSQFTHIALLHMMTDDDNIQFSTAMDSGIMKESLVAPIRENRSGYALSLDWARRTFAEKGELISKSLINPLAAGLVLRLLRFLTEEQKESWLNDLLSLLNASRRNVALLASLPDWEPCLFHLISDTMESVRTKSSQQVEEDVKADLAGSPSRKEVARLDVVLDIYGALLGHLLRVGTEKVLDAVETTASLERTCINGTAVLLMVLSRFCSNLFDFGTILEIGSFSAAAWKDIDLDHDSLPLKQSAKLVTDAIANQGTKGLDMPAAVRSWRSLRHLTEVIVAVTIKSGFGTVELFDYRIQRAAAVDSVTSGLHGFRLPDGRLYGITAEDYFRYTANEPAVSTDEGRAVNCRFCVSLSAQILILLDAFIFPDSLESSSPLPQIHSLALVKNSEARLGSSQGPLVCSAMRLSFVLLVLLEPCSVKFLQCVSRLRTLLDWALELIEEFAVVGGQPVLAFHQGVAHIDRILLATLLHSHRALGRCGSLLSEIEFSLSGKYFESRDSQKKYQRRLLRSAKGLYEIVAVIVERRGDVVKETLSNLAYDALILSLREGKESDDKSTKDQSIRSFLKSQWVKGFQDVENRFEVAIPEQVANDSHLRANGIGTAVQGLFVIEKISKESEEILADFEKALDNCFTNYLESQRKWAETDAVRDIEYDGDIILKRLSDRYQSDIADNTKDAAARRSAAEQRWKVTGRLVMDPWREPRHWMLPKWTDRMGRRQILLENKDFDTHFDARYDMTEDEGKTILSEESGNDEHNLSEVIRRNADAFTVGDVHVDGEPMDDDTSLVSDGESAILESLPDMSEAVEEIGEPMISTVSEAKMIQDVEMDASWDKISSEDYDGDEDGDIDGWAKNYFWSHGESIVGRFDPVMIISLQTYAEGRLLMTTDSLYFLPSSAEVNIMTKESTERSEMDKNGKRWKLTHLNEIHGRRYLLKHQAIELFFADKTDLLLNFPAGPRERDRFYGKLRSSCKLPMLWSPKTLNPKMVFRKSKMTDLWKKRKISTFEYLVAINKMAGRSFNDLTQYPVFPWVIADYTSESIDIDDPRIYRDLSKPVGALNQDRLTQLLERYNELEAFGFTEAEKFLYGSHYSSPGIVVHFLMRQEPFTTMHIQLQSGRFDCADRLFLDVSSSWNSCMTSSSDMKELVPEFYYLPEMFLNTNNFPLGRTQSGKLVDNVGLPPWAKGSAYEFVRINRLALESDHVSQNLCHWIDLVFGFKQRGPEAEAAHNIFHHLSYEGSVDLDKIANQIDREAAESHIQNFGQTPCQLISLDPHPPRGTQEECWKPLISDAAAAGRLKCYTPSKQFANMRSEHAKGSVVKLLVLADVVHAVYADMSVGTYRWSAKNKDSRLRMDRLRPMPGRELSTSRLSIKRGSEISSSALDESRHAMGPSSFALAMTGFSKEDFRRNSVIPSNILISHGNSNVSSLEGRFFMASCANWDETIKIHSADGFRVVASETGGHRGPIRSITTGDGGGILASGGEDCTVRIWVLDDPDLANALCDGYVQTALGPSSDGDQLLQCCHVLWGHESPITSLALSSDLDVVVSGSQTGRICLHSVHRGEFIRSFKPPPITKTTSETVAIRGIALGSSGLLVVHCEDLSLHTFTLNAMRLSSRKTGEKLHDMRLCSNDQFLITGGDDCQVKVWSVPDISVCAVLDLVKHGPIRCIGLTPEDLNPAEQFLFIGSDDGMITIVDNDLFAKDNKKEQF